MKGQPQPDEFRPTGLAARLFSPCRDTTYTWIVAAFLLGSFAHLWLADAWQSDWVIANSIYVLGMVILAITRGALGWILCAIGLAIPLLFLRDQLSQSVILEVFAICGAVTAFWNAGRNLEEPPAMFAAAVRGVTIVTYGLATFHKLNRDFVQAETSCANYGVHEVLDYYHIANDLIAPFEAVIPILALAVEGGICVAYLARRRRVAWLLATIFHLPITLTMAPAFAFVMLGGHLSFMIDEDRTLLASRMRRSWRWIIPSAAFLLAMSLFRHGSIPEITMIPKEGLLWLFLIWIWATFTPGRTDASPLQTTPRPPLNHGKLVVYIVVGGFTLNGFTPYLGVQYQHAAAMLSNLRIDDGCWNSYIIPESVRLTEDYVRIEEGWIGTPGRTEEYERIMAEQLWNPPQIRQMQRNWCKQSVRPLYIRGTYRGREFVFEDLCNPESPWPFEDDGVLNIEIFPDFLRFQKNLMRECPQTCIH